MDESKELVGMAVSVLLAVMILSGVMALITISYSIWNMFSQQDLANRKMKEYVNYASFDDTLIRGQEVVSLVSATHGTPFVIIFNGSNVIASSYDNVSREFVAQSENYHTSNTHLDDKLGDILGRGSAPIAINHYITQSAETKENGRWNFSVDTQTPTMEELQNFFLERGTHWGDHTPRYCGYESCIVYDSDSSTDVAGVLLYEVAPTED